MANYGVFKRIPPYDITRTKFNTYRQWNLTKNNFLSASIATDEHITFLGAIEPNPDNYYGGIATYSSSQVINDPKNTNTALSYVGTEYYASAVWYLLNHLYYADPYSYNSYGNINYDTAVKNLYTTASVISIPQRYIGDSIKPNSFTLTYNRPDSILLAKLIDDGNGNLIETNTAFKSYLSGVSNNVINLGFDKYKYYTPGEFDIPFTNFTYIPSDVTYVDSDILDTDGYIDGDINRPIGLAAKFSGSGYIQIRENKQSVSAPGILSPEYDEEFALSFWLFLDSHYKTNSSSYNYIITKRREGMGYVMDGNGNVSYTETDYNTNKFPYEIRIQNTGSTYTGNSSTILEAVRSDGTNTIILSASLNTGVSASIYNGYDRYAYHVLYQKTGSILELYIDGTKVQSGNDTTQFNFNNNCDLFIGNLGKNYGGFDGTIDEFNYITNALPSSSATTANSVNYLGSPDSIGNTNVVGNIFYKQGVVVITDPRPQYEALSYYNSTWNGLGPATASKFNVSYKSTVPIDEYEVLCRLREDEFRLTTNPTILKDYRYTEVLDIVTGSYWTPYITTIGLYNDNYELLAVGKLSSPIPKLNNADLNFIVRFDL